jgi:hypothetical protein
MGARKVSEISVLYVDLSNGTTRVSQYCDHSWIIRLSFEIGHINLLSHIFATLGAHPTELDLMRTRFLDFDNIDTR